MKKKILRKVIIVNLLLFSFLITGSSVQAKTPHWPNNAKFTRGVKNTCYWVSSGARSYTSKINAAAKSWAILDNNIKNTAVASNKGTHIDFYAVQQNSDSALNSNTYAYTSFWDSNGVLVSAKGIGPSKNYFFTEIVINQNNSSGITQGIIGHEMGHAYGLAHTIDQYTSIMWPYGNTMKVSTPQYQDNLAIRLLYP